MRLSDLTLLSPKGQNANGPQNAFKQHLKPSNFCLFCELGPICGQMVPIVSNALGCLKVLLWIGPKPHT